MTALARTRMSIQEMLNPTDVDFLTPLQWYDHKVVVLTLKGGDFFWVEHQRRIKVYLQNPVECTSITLVRLKERWSTQHPEWSVLLAYWFTQAVREAIRESRQYADITHLFARDLTASGGRILTRSQVKDLIAPSFDIVSKSREAIFLKYKGI